MCVYIYLYLMCIYIYKKYKLKYVILDHCLTLSTEERNYTVLI